MRSGLIPGVNVDRVDVAAGVKMAAQLGYGDPTAQMVAEFALMRHRRGEEEGAERTWLSEYPRDLTSWKAILAHALASAVDRARRFGPWPDDTVVRFTEDAKAAMTRARPGDLSFPRNLRTPAGGADRTYTIQNTPDSMHDVILVENGERWGIYWLIAADVTEAVADVQ
jgi:hypothetical protein